jgi:hypothetical protein
MIFDTDVLIWFLKGNAKAATLIDLQEQRDISAQTYMEILQGVKSKKEQRLIRNFLQDMGFHVLPLTEAIGHRASIYIEEYALSHGIRVGDAIIAATAIEHNLALSTSNTKHFRCIPGVNLKTFKP